MRFIIVIILINISAELLMQFFLYRILTKININILWKLKKLIVIYQTDISLLNIKAII